MNFKLKSLVLAVALAACAGQASAALDVSTTGATGAGFTGGSELVFFAWSSGKSYVQDLGVSVSDFLSGTGVSASVSSDYASFLSASGTNTIKWGVIGVRSGSTNVNATSIDWALTTVSASATAAQLAGQKSSNINALPGVFDGFTSFANNNSGFAATDGSYYVSSSTSDNWTYALKSNMAGKLNFAIDNLVGTNASFYLLNSVGSVTTTPIETKLSTASFNGSQITIAAVPEPESYAMLLSGLFMLGAIARRRIGKN